MRSGVVFALLSLQMLAIGSPVQRLNSTQEARSTPHEVRGYKVENAELKLNKAAKGAEAGELIRFDSVRVASLSPLGATLEVRATVAPVLQTGDVDLLVFDDVRVGGTPVTVNDYAHPFKIPENNPLTLPFPIVVYVSSPRAILGALGDLIDHQEMLPVTGRIYVCGHYKRLLMKFKRAVPVELKATMSNPF
jgi:hypothetical protein